MSSYISLLMVAKLCSHCFCATTHSKALLLWVRGNFGNLQAVYWNLQVKRIVWMPSNVKNLKNSWYADRDQYPPIWSNKMSLWCFVAQLIAFSGINGASSHSQEFKPVTYKCQKQGSYLELVYKGRDSNKRFLCQMERPKQELKTVNHISFVQHDFAVQKNTSRVREERNRKTFLLSWLSCVNGDLKITYVWKRLCGQF